MNHNPRFATLTDISKKSVKEITIEQVKAKLAKLDNFYFIDVREAHEFEQGSLPCAIHLSKGIIERDIEKLVFDSQAEIILYCGGGSRSALAAENLQKMGYTNVLSMAGGYRGWLESSYH
jgi:rhodanese-related sulfurtransferase